MRYDNGIDDFLYCPVCGSENTRIEDCNPVEVLTDVMLNEASICKVGPRMLRVVCGKCGHSVEGYTIDFLLSEWNRAERRPRR